MEGAAPTRTGSGLQMEATYSAGASARGPDMTDGPHASTAAAVATAAATSARPEMEETKVVATQFPPSPLRATPESWGAAPRRPRSPSPSDCAHFQAVPVSRRRDLEASRRSSTCSTTSFWCLTMLYALCPSSDWRALKRDPSTSWISWMCPVGSEGMRTRYTTSRQPPSVGVLSRSFTSISSISPAASCFIKRACSLAIPATVPTRASARDTSQIDAADPRSHAFWAMRKADLRPAPTCTLAYGVSSSSLAVYSSKWCFASAACCKTSQTVPSAASPRCSGRDAVGHLLRTAAASAPRRASSSAVTRFSLTVVRMYCWS
mmetsp:Transcript_22546/g.58856  ORF Transcript_22546/g.58856 Transcript_22546/m.58856 type:complete len:320 (+) Transcript_22546:181-1140(+)